MDKIWTVGWTKKFRTIESSSMDGNISAGHKIFGRSDGRKKFGPTKHFWMVGRTQNFQAGLCVKETQQKKEKFVVVCSSLSDPV